MVVDVVRFGGVSLVARLRVRGWPMVLLVFMLVAFAVCLVCVRVAVAVGGVVDGFVGCSGIC